MSGWRAGERRTVARAIRVEGRGLFTGTACAVTIGPAGAGEGLTIVALGVGGVGGAVVHEVGRGPASIGHRSSRPPHPALAALGARNTALAVRAVGVAMSGEGGGSSDEPVVQTTEHVLGALAGLGITDAVIGVEGPEVPIGDGSAAMFVEKIEARDLGVAVEPIGLAEGFEIVEGAGRVRVTPSDRPRWVYGLDYGPGAAVRAATAVWEGDEAGFRERVAPARTFSLAREVEAMRGAGLFRGFTARELLVIGEDGRAIENELRGEDEPARHKLLDLIGDVALATGGRPLLAEVVATRSGHRLNHLAAERIASLGRGR